MRDDWDMMMKKLGKVPSQALVRTTPIAPRGKGTCWIDFGLLRALANGNVHSEPTNMRKMRLIFLQSVPTLCVDLFLSKSSTLFTSERGVDASTNHISIWKFCRILCRDIFYPYELNQYAASSNWFQWFVEIPFHKIHTWFFSCCLLFCEWSRWWWILK